MTGGAGGGDEATAQATTRRLAEASELVLAGGEEMAAAAEGLSAETPEFESIRPRQETAVEKLAEALALLQPPPQQQQEQQEQQEQRQSIARAEHRPMISAWVTGRRFSGGHLGRRGRPC